ncbi:MAG: hypothetical protein A2992_06220 [Elusimicrobia bacterium RIFCSPLOWO2_01_FULL_59_12]|nr:MAG: hypothetical protein A2992_06220 [Elusimicrobia bacterium RIFCSPLOWO2_01_FULL_59_12]
MGDNLGTIHTPAAASGADVRLENFEGPLDLLLYLIRRDDLDIYDIPIAQITREYLSYLNVIKDLNLETAGDFLVMASTLMLIKAQMLLPSPEGEEAEGPDPRAELVSKLLEYQRYKEAAALLAAYNEKAKDVYYRQAPLPFAQEDFALSASVFDLIGAFQRILEEAPKDVEQILRDEIPLEVKIRWVLDLLAEKESIAFEDLFTAGTRRLERVVTFLALLELIRLKQITARQADVFGPIRLYRAEGFPLKSEEGSLKPHGR